MALSEDDLKKVRLHVARNSRVDDERIVDFVRAILDEGGEPTTDAVMSLAGLKGRNDRERVKRAIFSEMRPRSTGVRCGVDPVQVVSTAEILAGSGVVVTTEAIRAAAGLPETSRVFAMIGVMLVEGGWRRRPRVRQGGRQWTVYEPPT